MKTISLIGIALALCAPALALAQRGGGAGAVPRGDIQRVERGGALGPVRNVDIGRGEVARGDIQTGTRIPRGRAHNPARRRWNNANHPNPRRRWYNATHPPAPDRSRSGS